jgi:hypothetical protein
MYSADSGLRVASRVALLDRAALVIVFLAARDSYFQFNSPLLEIALCNDERHPFGFEFDSQFSNLLGVKQQFARALFVVPERRMSHFWNFQALYPSFAPRVDIDPRVPKIRRMLAQAAGFASY